MRPACRCGSDAEQRCRLVVLTGGPGAGKTAVLELPPCRRTHRVHEVEGQRGEEER